MTKPLVLVLMGVAGSGKSTVAAQLVQQLGWDFAEGDDFHPAENVEKMSSGVPLTDEDRWPWLDRLGGWIRDHIGEGRSAVVTCSSLRRAYRDRLRAPEVVFIHFDGTREQLASRLTHRTDHYMPASLLDSQLAELEPLQPDERGIVVPIDGPPEHLAAVIISRLDLTPAPST